HVACVAVDEEDTAIRAECAPNESPERIEARLRYVREPEAEEADVELLGGLPVEQVGDDVVDGSDVDTPAIDGERLRARVDGNDSPPAPREVPRPESGAGRELEHVTARIELDEALLHLADVGRPARIGLLAVVVAAASEPPVVVLRRSRRIVVALLREDVASHANTWKTTSVTSAPSAPP